MCKTVTWAPIVSWRRTMVYSICRHPKNELENRLWKILTTCCRIITRVDNVKNALAAYASTPWCNAQHANAVVGTPSLQRWKTTGRRHSIHERLWFLNTSDITRLISRFDTTLRTYRRNVYNTHYTVTTVTSPRYLPVKCW